MKFQDAEEVSAQDLADAFHQMHVGRRYRRALFLVDTCQANTLFETFYSPNIAAVGSSARDENSYSVFGKAFFLLVLTFFLQHHADYEIGVSVIDRFTYALLEFMERVKPSSSVTLDRLVRLERKRLIIGC